MIILHQCALCLEIQNPEDTFDESQIMAIVDDVICDACEIEAAAAAETFGVPTSDIEGDLALTRELI